jgi:exodeoxyribonuclease VII large subunit
MVDRSTPLSIRELTRQIKMTLEAAFPPLWVEGEVSDLRAASSGHLYFTLKDDEARIRAVMFRREATMVPFQPSDGMHVLVLARLTVYEARGDYQLVVDDMEPRGIGAMRQAMEQLRLRLEAEGLFSRDRKRNLPLFPTCVGVVTSAMGAAIRDILKVLQERDAPVRVIVSPALVQGREAPDSLVRALTDLVQHGETDVIIIGRGGGSFEDLLPFSDEKVVRAVAECPIPIVSAVGHEIDISLTDLAADVRAPTPSAAAEMVAAGREEILGQLMYLASRLLSAVRHMLRDAREQALSVGSRVVHPRHLLEQGRMRLDDLSFRLVSHVRTRLRECRADLNQLSGLLRSLGPQAVLDRGYAVVRKTDGTIVRSPGQVAAGEGLDVRVAEGEIKVKVESGRLKGKPKI